jgi:hypothetical protein
MLDSKFFFTLVGLVVAVFAICNTNMQPAISENWGMNPTSKKVVRENLHRNGRQYAVKNNTQAMLQNHFVTRPNFQAMPSTRFDDKSKSSIRYGNIPSYEHRASPCKPIDWSTMAKEDYQEPGIQENFGCSKGACGGSCGRNCEDRCGKGRTASMNSQNISEDKNYVSALNEVYSPNNTLNVLDGSLNVGDMTTINSTGGTDTAIVIDRYIYANTRSRLRRHGDHLRGDLAIVPNCGNGNGWFNVHPTPHLDLHSGALKVMGGDNNETNNTLSEFLFETSGGSQRISSGVDMSGKFDTQVSGGAINYTSFV